MKLTEHFSLEEFTRSSTAIAKGIDNNLNPDNPKHAEIIANIKALCENVLEPLRSYINETSTSKGDKRGSVPVIISSGYRCPKLNAAVGGVQNSQHLKGEAADIHMPDLDKLKAWFVWLMDNTNFDQMILERATPTSEHWWIHVSCKLNPKRNRHQVIQGLIKRNA